MSNRTDDKSPKRSCFYHSVMPNDRANSVFIASINVQNSHQRIPER